MSAKTTSSLDVDSLRWDEIVAMPEWIGEHRAKLRQMLDVLDELERARAAFLAAIPSGVA